MSNISIKYKIIELVPEEHSITVRFFTDKITEDMLATEFNNEGDIVRRNDGSPLRCRTDYFINIMKTPTPSIDEVKEMIKLNAPAEWLYMQEQILNPTVDTSLTDLEPLLNTTGVIVKEVAEPIYNSSNTNVNVNNTDTNNI